jgi:hypothetical protein
MHETALHGEGAPRQRHELVEDGKPAARVVGRRDRTGSSAAGVIAVYSERLRALQIACRALSGPLVRRSQQVVRLLHLALVAPEAGEREAHYPVLVAPEAGEREAHCPVRWCSITISVFDPS